jgi:NAD(P)-dependent dehydrogenase (short-subunit alcohol dehydrogenase family)
MKSVVITGAGRGIGLALTKEFSRQGFRVLGTYRSEKSAQGLLQLTQEADVSAVTADITDEKTFGPLTKKLEEWGSVDILVNNAGVIGQAAGSLRELNPSKMMETFDTNTFGPLRVSQAVMPFLNKNGKIAHVSSLMGSVTDNTSGGYYDYRMSKAALNMFNSCLAKEFPKLTCLVLHPGWVQTDMGGAGAAVTPEESARGLCQVILNAKLEQSGQFFEYTGRNLPW